MAGTTLSEPSPFKILLAQFVAYGIGCLSSDNGNCHCLIASMLFNEEAHYGVIAALPSLQCWRSALYWNACIAFGVMRFCCFLI